MLKGRSRDFSKPWDRDAHLPKLDPRLLPPLKMRWWTPAELAEYCREKPRNDLLDAALVERWLETAQERGLTRQRVEADGRWEATAEGRSKAGFATSVLQRLGGLSGMLGLVSFFLALSADRLSSELRPIAVLAMFYLAALLVSVVGGRLLAERSRTLLRRVAEREELVQQSGRGCERHQRRRRSTPSCTKPVTGGVRPILPPGRRARHCRHGGRPLLEEAGLRRRSSGGAEIRTRIRGRGARVSTGLAGALFSSPGVRASGHYGRQSPL
jgi:hypothetical protein